MVTLSSSQVAALKIILEKHIPVWNRMSKDSRVPAMSRFQASYFSDIATDLLQTIGREQAAILDVEAQK